MVLRIQLLDAKLEERKIPIHTKFCKIQKRDNAKEKNLKIHVIIKNVVNG